MTLIKYIVFVRTFYVSHANRRKFVELSSVPRYSQLFIIHTTYVFGICTYQARNG